MKKRIYFMLLFLMVAGACKKEDIHNPVIAGNHHPGLSLFEFLPPFHLEIKTDTLLNVKYGIDSFDINSDGNYDLVIAQRMAPDFIDSTMNPENTYPYCSVNLKNGLEVAVKEENIYIGLGQTTTLNWVDTIRFNTRIDNIAKWSEANIHVWMWVVPPTSFRGTYGCWYTLINTEMYAGIRMKIGSTYKYGWIKFNQVSRGNVSVINYALEP